MTVIIDQQEISNIDIGLPEYWTYKSEGAMNIVLAYTGPYNEDLNGLVLRVKKESNGGSSLEKEIELFKFVSKVMSPLLGEKYVFCGSMINISKQFLEKLDDLIYIQRPITRSKIRLDTNLTVAFLIMDLTKLDNFNLSIDHDSIQRSTLSPKLTNQQYEKKHPHDKESVICIEIKPKWGFLPKQSTSIMNKDTRDIKSNTCRYCMHQYLKFQENSIGDISNYCPIDLFSVDNSVRQERSIRELINHPQNNLKIYYNGLLSFTGSLGGGSERDELSNCKILSNLLFEKNIIRICNGNSSVIEDIDIESTINSFSKLVVKILQRESILSNIKNAQLFDKYDIEAIYYLYNKINGLSNENSNLSDDSINKLNQLSINEIKEIINQFMISCTAKDCSIMISFTLKNSIKSDNELNNDNSGNLIFINSLDENDNVNQNSNSNSVIYKIGVVDLDTKKQSAIPKYYKLDQEIVKVYKNSVKSIKSCK